MQSMKLFSLLLFFSVKLVCYFLANASGIDTDRLSLLKFKQGVTSDPHGVLNSWNDSVPHCDWVGIKCGLRHHRVTSMELNERYLAGSISSYISNLSFLRIIDMENNSFYGSIPREIGRLFRLQEFRLRNNTVGGKFLVSITNCSQLRIIDLSYNEIAGTLPEEIGLLKKLEGLGLVKNKMTGKLPSSIGNISACTAFGISYNNMRGSIPEEMGRLTKLTILSMGSNDLSGVIPPSFFNITSLNFIAITDNRFHGNLLDSICLTLPNLQILVVGGNRFSGRIPKSVSNCSQLEIIDMTFNNFVGQVPNDLGKLQNLELLNLQKNNLGSNSKDDLSFLVSMTNCSNLKTLSFASNHFGGILPKIVVNFSTELSFFVIGGNQISGSIPVGLDKFVKLIGLHMNDNLFSGSIPFSIGKLEALQSLLLHRNRLLGEIPSSIGNLSNLYELKLFNNKLEKSIPSSLGNLKRLRYLDLSGNNLNGEIPPQVLLLPSLSKGFFLTRNMLRGILPLEVGKLENLYSFSVAENNLSGEIPTTIGGCSSVEILHLQGNSFEGSIPSSMVSLRRLRELDLSKNNLSGQIPKFLENLTSLKYLNLSLNNFEGEVPVKGIFGNVSAISLRGNAMLCGGNPELHLPKCPSKKTQKRRSSNDNFKLAIVIPCVVVSVFLMIAFFLLYRKRSLKKPWPSVSGGERLIRISYGDIYRATNGFSPDNLIGSGGFGSVYKGSLTQVEKPVAVKVLDLEKKGAAKSFMAECRALRNIRHKNLVKILTYCSTIDYKRNEFKALVYEFMALGSLEGWLRPRSGCEGNSSILNVLQRLNIAIDIASALYYLHNHCEISIIHCDLKPSNLLLDEDMVAHLGDFGLAKLLTIGNEPSQSQTSTIENRGTVGYAAPEYGTAAAASKEGDVYSYGIVLLEMFSGRRPTDEMFKEGLNLHGFVKEALPKRLLQIIDPSLFHRDAITEVAVEPYDYDGEIAKEEVNNNNLGQMEASMQNSLVAIFEIGIACSVESAKERMKMKDVSRKLEMIKTDYLNNSSSSNRSRRRMQMS